MLGCILTLLAVVLVRTILFALGFPHSQALRPASNGLNRQITEAVARPG